MKRSVTVVIIFGLLMLIGSAVILSFVQQQSGTFDTDEQQLHPTTPTIKDTGIDDQLAHLPKDVPIYPSIIADRTFVTVGEDSSFILGLESNDSVSDVVAFYQIELSANSWSVDQMDTDTSGAAVLTIQKNDRYGAVSVNRDSDTTIISMTVGAGNEQAGL